MSGCIFTACTTGEGLLASSSAKTVLKIITTTNQSICVKEWGVFFDGVLVTQEPVLVQLRDYTTAEANWTTAAHTPLQRSGKTIISRAVCQALATSSSHGFGTVYATREVHPQSGYQEKFGYGDEIQVVNGSAIGIYVVSPTTVNCMAEITYSE